MSAFDVLIERGYIQQGGLYVNDNKIESIDAVITEAMFSEDGMIVRKGKKTYHRVIYK